MDGFTSISRGAEKPPGGCCKRFAGYEQRAKLGFPCFHPSSPSGWKVDRVWCRKSPDDMLEFIKILEGCEIWCWGRVDRHTPSSHVTPPLMLSVSTTHVDCPSILEILPTQHRYGATEWARSSAEGAADLQVSLPRECGVSWHC